MDIFNPSRMDLARRRRGKTKRELAEALGVTMRSLQLYATGESKPTRATLGRMAEVLQFPVAFFEGSDLEEPPLEGSSFRSLTRLTARQRDQSLASGALALAFGDWVDARFRLPQPEVTRHEGVEPDAAATALRNDWRLGQKPIKNLVTLLEMHGVRVFSLTEKNVEMDAFSFWRGDKPYVFLNTMKSSEHARFDAAHELGHLVLHSRGSRTRTAEHEADRFASEFLMPRSDILAEAPRARGLDDLIVAKRRWNVSLAALAYRLHTVRLLSDWQYRALFVEISKRGYRKSEPNSSQPERSQIWDKVLTMLKDQGVSRREIAAELSIPPAELAKVVFGLVLTAQEGGSGRISRGASREHLRVL